MERLIGKQAPYFSMEALSADGEHFVRVALPDYAGKWLVLFFYPMDFTFVCPTELTAFSEHREAFRAAGAELLSVSTDSVYTHQAWQRNGLGGLGYPMAADQTLRVCADYGVLLEEEGVALRGLFLIDPEQKVRDENLRLWQRDKELWLFPVGIEALIGKVRFSRLGIKLAETHNKGYRWQHEAVIALASPDNMNAFELTPQEAEEWYRGRDVYPQAAPVADDVLVTFQHQPIGLAKRIGSRLKNSYPRELVRDGKLFTGNA